MSHSSNHFAIAMVVLAGIMWAGSGVGAQNFFEKCSMNAMELTAFRMIAAGCILIGVTIWQGRMKKASGSFERSRGCGSILRSTPLWASC